MYDFVHQGLNHKLHTSRGRIDWRTIAFHPSVRWLIDHSFRKHFYIVEIIPFFKIFFFRNYSFSFDFFHQYLHQNLYFCRGAFDMEDICFDPCIWIRELQTVLPETFWPDVRTHVFPWLLVWFLSLSSKMKVLHFWRSIRRENHCFLSFHQNPYSPKILKTAIGSVISRDSDSFFSVSTDFISIENSFSMFFASKFQWSQKFNGEIILFDLSRYWKS